MDQNPPGKICVPAKYAGWLFSLLGGSLLIAYWAYLYQAGTAALTQGPAAVTPGQPAGQPSGIPSGQIGFREADGEYEYEDDGIRTPGAVQPPVAARPPASGQPQPSPAAKFKDGVYQATSQTFWGPLTVQVTVSGGVWSEVRALVVPNSPPSQYAAPYLAQQALAAQNSAIDGVSGATYASNAFRDDLAKIVQQSKL